MKTYRRTAGSSTVTCFEAVSSRAWNARSIRNNARASSVSTMSPASASSASRPTVTSVSHTCSTVAARRVGRVSPFALEVERAENLTPEQAIYKACIIRFRPIMMTTMAALLGALPLAIGFGTGWFLGGPDVENRRVLALGTAQRNIAAALVVAGQSFSDPKVVVMVVVVAIVGLLVLMPVSRRLAVTTIQEAQLPTIK